MRTTHILLAGLVAASAPAQLPTDSLIAWWPFNGNALDESGHDNDGSIFGGVTGTADRFGMLNSAYSFDGIDGFISTQVSPDFQRDTLTISAWMRLTEAPWNGNTLCFGSSASTRWGVNADPNQVAFHANWGCGTDAGAYVLEGLNPTFTWIHLLCVLQDTMVDVYRDGVLVTTFVQQAPTCYDADYAFTMGVDIFSVAEFWAGGLDDVAIWDRALTAAEIEQVFEAGTTGMAGRAMQPAFTAWPVPCSSLVQLHFPGLSRARLLRLLDGTGRTIRTVAVPSQTSEMELNLDVLAPGPYLARFDDQPCVHVWLVHE